MDKVNKDIIADGLTPRETDFATVKQQIRDAIDESIRHVGSFEELTRWLEQKYGIKTKISCGQFSYIHPEHKKPIRGKALGLSYDRNSIESRIRGDENIEKPEYGDLPRVFLIASDLCLVTDIQSCIKAQQSRVYAQKVAISKEPLNKTNTNNS